uniref:Uncharacterized protein n=1 Tax=Sphaerodactylus townsendi TaxID=933632 RepID=A0ACB8FTF6_9SAUR
MPKAAAARAGLLEPWKIALIVLAGLALLAIVVGLLVYFLAFDQKKFFYNATFRINNVPYQPSLKKQTSEEFRQLSMSIETLIHQAFEDHTLKKKMIQSSVVRLSPDEGAVLADAVLVFKFTASDSREALQDSVYSALLRRLRAPVGSLSIDLASYRLSGVAEVFPLLRCSLPLHPALPCGQD